MNRYILLLLILFVASSCRKELTLKDADISFQKASKTDRHNEWNHLSKLLQYRLSNSEQSEFNATYIKQLIGTPTPEDFTQCQHLLRLTNNSRNNQILVYMIHDNGEVTNYGIIDLRD